MPPESTVPPSADAGARARDSARPALRMVKSGELRLEAKDIVKSYGKRPVLKGISLDVGVGEVVGLFGPNGAGKSTCFQILAGLLRPDSGEVLLNGVSISTLPMYKRAREGIGYLPQQSSIFRNMTVEKNLMVALEATEKDPQVRQDRLDTLLGEFSISHLRSSLGITLSGGERRRCEIARALATNPRFLLFDEPLAGIDPLAIADLRILIATLKERGIGVLITDHQVREALDFVDRGVMLHNGEILVRGTPRELVEHTGVREVYLGKTFRF